MMTRWLLMLIASVAGLKLAAGCVDVLFVIDNRTLEISRSRAIQVARQLPEDQKIRKWVVLSREDRYVPRVLRNNAELQQVLATIHGDYDRFLDVATGEIQRRTATFQPFVILLFSETPVNQTMSMMWRKMSLAPALHIYRIGSFQKNSRMLSEDQETDFEKLILCGRNKTNDLLLQTGSSKFDGARNDIRRAPTSTSTHRPLTSTRDPFVRRLTFYDASRTLLEDKPVKKKTFQPPIHTQYTITRTFKKMTSTTPMSPTTTTKKALFTTRFTNRPFSTTSRSATFRTFTSTIRPAAIFKFSPQSANSQQANTRTTSKWTTSNSFGSTPTTKRTEWSPRWTTTSRIPTTTRRPTIKKTSVTKSGGFSTGLRSTERPIWTTSTVRPSGTTTRRWYIPFGKVDSGRTRSQVRVSTTTRRPESVFRKTTTATRSRTTKRPDGSSKWFVPFEGQPTGLRSVSTSTTRPSPLSSTRPTPRWYQPYTRRPEGSRQQMTTTTTSRPRWAWNSAASTPRSIDLRPRPSWQFQPTGAATGLRAPSTTTTPSTTTRRPEWTTRRRDPVNLNLAVTRRPAGLRTSSSNRDSTFWHPTPSPAPVSTIELPPQKLETNDLMEEFRHGKNFKVRSRSVHFAMTEKPPPPMNPMMFFSTTRTPVTTAKPLIPFSCTADVFFLVDLSQGTGDKSQQYLDIAASAIGTLPISQDAVRVGLISYSGPGRTAVRVHLDKHKEKEKLIEEMFLMERHGGTTRTADAIRYASRVFDDMAHPSRRNVKKVLVVFTDGYSQDNPKEAARVARAKGLQLVAVAVSDKLAPPDEQQLADIGGHSRNVLISPTGRALREKILGTQCRL